MRVYFDNAATTAVRQEAADLAARVMTQQYGNPSSTHTLGREAQAILREARKNVAAAIGAGPDTVYFTSGGTESDNWAIYAMEQLTFRGAKHAITTAVEHDAVRRPMEALAARGWEVTVLQPDGHGRISAEAFEDALREDTAFASVMLVNNETGAVNPVSAMSAVIRRRGYRTLLHTDAVQGLCKVPIAVRTLGADLISLSSHKIYGPKGAGALYVRKDLRIKPLLLGGGQEDGLRSGTEPLPAIAAFGEAARLGKVEMAENVAQMREIRDWLSAQIPAAIPGAMILSPGDAPHILSISLPGYRSEVLMNALEADEIYVSKSSACKRGGRSHVLEAMGLSPRIIDGALRVSFSRCSTMEQAEYFLEKLQAASLRLAHR